MWDGTLASIPSDWVLADGQNGTPDLRSQFVKGASTLGGIGGTGGSLTHGHTATGHTHAVASHSHTVSAANGAGTNTHAGSTDASTTAHAHTSWSNTGASSFTSGTGTPTVDDYTDTQPPFYTVAYIQLRTFDQAAYRFFTNADSTDVGSTLAAQDTAASLSTTGQAFRLRMIMRVNGVQLPTSGKDFKLQFAEQSGGACDNGFSGESYSDVTGSTLIAYNNNSPSN